MGSCERSPWARGVRAHLLGWPRLGQVVESRDGRENRVEQSRTRLERVSLGGEAGGQGRG